jgi:hypothetical protein
MHEPGRKKRGFFGDVLEALSCSSLPFLIGGGYALQHHTGRRRPVRDLDLFVRPQDAAAILRFFDRSGYPVEVLAPHWLGKIYKGRAYVDVIWGSGNGIAVVDDGWFEHATEGKVHGTKVLLSPAEEMIWSKSFVMERERFDGADVIHLIFARGLELDWRRLIARFGRNRLVLLSHLVLFLFVYPSERGRVPLWVWDELTKSIDQELEEAESAGQVCRGTLLSRSQYLSALAQGFRDARIPPDGSMKPEDVVTWTEAASVQERTAG